MMSNEARKNYEQETMTDGCIFRADARKVLCDYCLGESTKVCGTNCPIDNIPAADVAPMVHAHWEDVSVDDEGSMLIASMFCSNCKRWHNEVCHYGSPTEMAHYCPNCGATMDESEGDGE